MLGILGAALVVGGIIFLLLAFARQFMGEIRISKERQKVARILGVALLSFGIIAVAIPRSGWPPPAPTPIVSPPPPDTPLPTPRPTHTPMPSPTVTPPETLGLIEPFYDRSGGWIEEDDGDSRFWIEEGEYHTLVRIADTYTLPHPGNRYRDFSLRAAARQVSDRRALYGLIFRYQDADNYYRFVIYGEGLYSMTKRMSAQWVDIVEWTFSPAINQGQAENTLRVACVGDEITAWVNGEELTSVRDASFEEGYVGVTVGGWEPGVHVAFDSIVLSAIE